MKIKADFYRNVGEYEYIMKSYSEHPFKPPPPTICVESLACIFGVSVSEMEDDITITLSDKKMPHSILFTVEEDSIIIDGIDNIMNRHYLRIPMRAWLKKQGVNFKTIQKPLYFRVDVWSQ